MITTDQFEVMLQIGEKTVRATILLDHPVNIEDLSGRIEIIKTGTTD